MATHSSMLASEIPWTEEHVGQQSMGSQRDMTERLSTHARAHTHTHIHENGFNNLTALVR